MSALVMEAAVILLLILCNGILAMTEMCLVASRKSRLEQRANRGKKGAAVAVELLENPTRFLSAIQVGISLVGILTGVFGGATIGEELAKWFSLYESLVPYAETLSIACVVVVVTYFSVILGELVPKRIGLSNPEALASLMAIPMRWITTGLGPVVGIMGKSTEFVLHLLRIPMTEKTTVVEEEIRSLLREGTLSGDLAHMEKRMVERVLRLGDQLSGAIMTPRTEIMWLDLDESRDRLMENIRSSHHSLYPVGQGKIDHIRGFIRAKDILTAMLEGKHPDIAVLMTPAVFLPDTTTALDVLETLKEKRLPVVFLVDEHGGVDGMITLSDVLKAIVGTLPEHSADAPAAMHKRDDGSLLLDGLLSIDEFKSLLAIHEQEDDEPEDYLTLGGFVMKKLERVPAEGDIVEWRGLRIEVVDMDGNRVDKVLVQTVSKQPSNRGDRTRPDGGAVI